MNIYLAIFGKPRYLGLVNIADTATPVTGRWVVLKTVRGLEMGQLGGSLSQEQAAKYKASCLEDSGEEQTRTPEPMLQEVEFVEQAGELQVQEYFLRRADEETVVVRARQILKNHQLQMKLVDVEYTMDRKKLFFYFTSEQRIDFRAYVRDLAREFRIRIEMRQIGVRDEAKTVHGISPCGRPCCCSYWLHRFTPINIRMVKEQNLALNPTKISGICGRLMCCMAYEHNTYSELWKSLPSPGSKIRTPQGNFVLEGVDLQSKNVLIRFPEGREVPVAIAEFENFREVVLNGGTWEKNVPEEPVRRPPLLSAKKPGSLSTKSSLLSSSASSAAREDAPKYKKLKPEKISIEEHLAEREDSIERPAPPRNLKDRLAARKESRDQAPGEKAGEKAGEKELNEVKGKEPREKESRGRDGAGNKQARRRSDQRPARSPEKSGGPQAQGSRKERPRPPENRRTPRTDAPKLSGGESGGGEEKSGTLRRRSRRRVSGEARRKKTENPGEEKG